MHQKHKKGRRFQNAFSPDDKENMNKKVKKFLKKKTVGRVLWLLMKYSPKRLKAGLLKRLMPVPQCPPEGIIFKRADTFEEIKMALELVYESYRDLNIVAKNSHQIRLTKYHTLPTTAVLIAKDTATGQVVATMSIIIDSPLGLPLEELWNIDPIRKDTRRMAEISSLAVKRSYRSRHGDILFPLCKYMYQLSKQHLGIDTLLASIHPMVKDLYTCIFPFHQIDTKVHSYDFVEGAKAIGIYVKINGQGEKELEAQWGKEKSRYNYYHYLLSRGGKEFEYPPHNLPQVVRYFLTPDQISYLFKHCSSILMGLSPTQRLALANNYHLTEYHNVLIDESAGLSRQHARFVTALPCRLYLHDTIIPGTVMDASIQGLKVFLDASAPRTPQDGELFHLSISLSSGTTTSFACKITWTTKDKKLLGAHLTQPAPKEWRLFIESHEEELKRAAGVFAQQSLRKIVS